MPKRAQTMLPIEASPRLPPLRRGALLSLYGSLRSKALSRPPVILCPKAVLIAPSVPDERPLIPVLEAC